MASANSGNFEPSDTDTILESLASFAPINTPALTKTIRYSVRDVINIFEWTESAKYNIDKISSIHKTSLISTLHFLKIKHNSKVLDVDKVKMCEKNEIATLIYNKIRSYLPQLCSNCNLQFTVPFHDDRQDKRLHCHSCSAPSHDCYVLTYPNLPKSSPLVWLCDDCSHSLSSTVVKNLHSTPILSPNTVPDSPHTTIPQQSLPAPLPPTPPPAISLSPPDQNNPPESQSPQPDIPLSSPPESQLPQPDIPPSNPPSTPSTSIDELPSPPPSHTNNPPQSTLPTKHSVPKICHFLQKGICKYGASGQLNGSCPGFHPRQCKAFLNRGTTDNGGCKRGRNCSYWHPTYLCRNSVRFMECSRTLCNYQHHKLCRRPRPNSTPSPPFLRHSQVAPNLPRLPPWHNAHPPAQRNPLIRSTPQVYTQNRTSPHPQYPSPPPQYPYQRHIPPLMSIPLTPLMPPPNTPFQPQYQNPAIHYQNLEMAIRDLGQHCQNLVSQAQRLQAHF